MSSEVTATTIANIGNVDAARPRPRLLSWNVTDSASHIPASLLTVTVACADMLVLVSSGLLAGMFSAGAELHWQLITPAAIGCALLAASLGLTSRKALEERLTGTAPALVLSLVLTVSIVALIGLSIDGTDSPSRVRLATWIAFSAIAWLFARKNLSTLVRSWAAAGRLERRAAIYGSGTACADLIRSMEADARCDLRIVGVCDDRGGIRAGDAVLGYPRIGTLDDLIEMARRSRIDTVIVTLPMAAERRLLQIFDKLRLLPSEVCQPASATNVRFSPKAYSYVGLLPMLSIQDKPIGSWGMIAKSASDKIVAACALLLLSPLLAAVAIAIKLDSKGPVLFRQNRYGFNNELIGVFKFRSMFTDRSDATAQRLVTRNDTRVTRVGRFIRKTSLDELPQLINVLRGELSLVGPRPHAVNAKAADKLYGDVVRSYFARHKVKPGITGWAQVNGWRGETDTEEKIIKRVEHDLHYVENWSLLLDLEILVRTPLSLLNTENAY